MADEDHPGPSLNFGQAIGEKISESIKNMDVMAVLKKIVASTADEEQSVELQEKLKGVLEKYNAMTEDEQAHFAEQMKEALASKISMRMSEAANKMDFSGVEDAIKEVIFYKLLFIGVAALVILILIVFFGYKLFKSIKEKEKKREEKKKAKQMKKKK